MADVTHLIVTDEGEHRVLLESPQVPGLFFGRPTRTEFVHDYQQVLRDVGVTGFVRSHRHRRFTSPEGQEYLVRFADGDGIEERLEVISRLHRALATDQRSQMLSAPAAPTGEVVFVAVAPGDTIGDLADQMYGERDVLVVAAAVADEHLFNTYMASGDRSDFPGWHTVSERGWNRETTVSEVMRDLASAPSSDRRLLV